MIIRLADVEKQISSIDESIDLDWIRPDLREALDRKQASHDINRPEAVKKRYEQVIERQEKILNTFVMMGVFWSTALS